MVAPFRHLVSGLQLEKVPCTRFLERAPKTAAGKKGSSACSYRSSRLAFGRVSFIAGGLLRAIGVYKRKDLRWDSREGGFRPSFCPEGGADFSQGLAYGGVRALRGGAEEEIGSLATLVFPCVDLEVEVLGFAGGEGLDPL